MSINRSATQTKTQSDKGVWTASLRMAARAATALVGGYAAAAGSATLLARLLPGSPVEASAWGMVASFPAFAVLGLWAFHERRLLQVTVVIWGAALLSIGAALLLGVRP
ncbi:MAG: hypothetical protein WA047_14825 [Phenylobacterium sp.]|uniref:hypothetical protein n=1 Tax=Phenylobacterium sp. TaxID=1871053 RepID=UPI003BB64433